MRTSRPPPSLLRSLAQTPSDQHVAQPVHFWRHRRRGCLGEGPDILHRKYGCESCPIAVETVTFITPQVGGFKLWVRQLTSKMQETKCWDWLSKLILAQNVESAAIQKYDVGRWCAVASEFERTGIQPTLD